MSVDNGTPRDPFGREVDERVAEYDVRSPASRTLITVIGTLVAVLALVVVFAVVANLTKDTRTESTTLDLDGIAQIRLEATSADIALQPARGEQLEISARVTGGLIRTDYVLGRRGDTFVIDGGCRPLLAPGCGIEVTVSVPSGFPVVVDTTSGNVSVTDLDGVVTINSSSGDIEARGVTVVELSAFTEAGDVDVAFAEQPYGFKARTTSGDVDAVIPTGSIEYSVITKTDSGEIDSNISHVEDGEGFITVETTTGDIDLQSR